jgi:O-Antigen ligase
VTQLTTEQFASWDGRTAGRAIGLQRFVAGWAAFGVTLSGATQLRMEGLPVGPSEVILAVWLAFVAFLLLRGVRLGTSRVFLVMGGYWLAQLAILGFGAAVALYARRFDSAGALHDGLAYVYVAVLSTFLCLRLCDTDDYDYHWTFARLIFLFHALAGGLLLAIAMVAPQLGPIRFWYAGIRFLGWAENPNQMALAMAAMPFLGWWLMRRASGPFGKAACLVGIVLCVAVGVATKSDGMRVAWAASLGAIAAVLFYQVTMRGRSRWLHVSHLIIPVLVVVAGVSFGDEIAAYVTRVAEEIYAEADQGDKRFTLWRHGLQAISESALVGFGPGSYSGVAGPFEGREAHNSFIDWGMSTGAVGIAIYLGLLAWTVRRALQSGETMPIGMLISVVMVSTFGYVLRQPGFWMVLVLVLVLSERSILMRKLQSSQAVLDHGRHTWRSTARSVPHFERNRLQ